MTVTIADRRPPALGGFNFTALRIEAKRLLRDKRTIAFTVFFPIVMYLAFGIKDEYEAIPAGEGNLSATLVIKMAVYGALVATTGGGAAVATERALGWSRQLRLTPLAPVAHIAMKTAVALLLGLVSVIAVNVVGIVAGKAEMPVRVWILAALIAWLGSMVFGAFGLFMGYLLPSENVMQIVGPVLATLGALGGLWFPIDDDSILGRISAVTPLRGLADIAVWPLMGETPSIWAFVNLFGWFAVFVAGAAWRMSKDTSRV